MAILEAAQGIELRRTLGERLEAHRQV